MYPIQLIKRLLMMNDASIDNSVFRLHYMATMALLIIFSIVVTSQQYLGNPMQCIVDGVPSDIVESYCWVTSTSVVPENFESLGVTEIGSVMAHYDENEPTIKYQKQYQLVCYVLMFQAILFYLPRYFWKIFEGGRVKTLTSDHKIASLDQERMGTRCKLLSEYFVKNLNKHNYHLGFYVFCEVLNFVNVVAQILLMDFFLGGVFTQYGLTVLKFTEMDYDKRYDPMQTFFPKVTKCSFHNYKSGKLMEHDAMCVLPINIISEKICVILWYWFVFLSVFSAIAIFYRVVVILSPQLRYLLVMTRFRIVSSTHLYIICKTLGNADWFVFYQIANNIDQHIFKQLVISLAEELRDITTTNINEMYCPPHLRN